MSRVTWLALATATTLLLVSCRDRDSSQEAKASEATAQRLRPDGSIQLADEDRTALGLVMSAAVEGDLPNSSLRFGRVLSPPANEGQVVAPVTGRIVRAPRVQLGATVRAGATVLDIAPVLDTPDRIAVGTQSAERAGQIDAAERELTKAEADARRARELSPQVVSASKLQGAETAAATARARLEGLRNARAAADRAHIEAVSVTTPISGVVSALHVDVGAMVNKGDVLARILSNGPVWIDVSVPPDDPQGDDYIVETPAGSIPARLLARGRLTETDGTRHDRLAVESPPSATLSLGSSVPVHVARGSARGVLVPESALVPGVDGDTIFVETSPNTFAARPVQIAARFGGRLRVSSGIKVGERVVIQGVMGLQGERLRSQLRNVEQ